MGVMMIKHYFQATCGTDEDCHFMRLQEYEGAFSSRQLHPFGGLCSKE